ncbi:MAG: hypothetical protein M3R17_06435, partial [Bacteroidota bacterium]|nr:hypothetical protein [Bacteroidota bacterium]
MRGWRVASLLLALFFASSLTAQTNWNFAAPTDGAGSANSEVTKGMCTDASGNVYVAGLFNGSTTDFDILGGVVTAPTSSTQDGYIVSYDKNGAYRWHTIMTSTIS